MVKKIYSLIHTKIYNFLVKHPFLDAFVSLMRGCKDKAYCKTVAGRNDLQFVCKSFGNLNKEKNIYLIKHGKHTSGFFVQMRELIKYFGYADRFGLYPVVVWSHDLPYAEEYEVCGTTNPFEYYFKQPFNISVNEVYKSYNVFESKTIHIDKFFYNRECVDGEKGYWMSEEYMDYLGQIVKKYIILNEHTETYIQKSIADLFQSKKTIGVHIRGTDFKNNYNNHPINATIEEYFSCIDRMLLESNYNQIFLATDDINILEQFIKKYGDILVYYKDVRRAQGNISVAFSEDKREKHHYLLGLEVLRDMYSLVACDGMVSGISQVSLAARIFKKSRGQEYSYKYILDKGYNKNKNNFVM